MPPLTCNVTEVVLPGHSEGRIGVAVSAIGVLPALIVADNTLLEHPEASVTITE